MGVGDNFGNMAMMSNTVSALIPVFQANTEYPNKLGRTSFGINKLCTNSSTGKVQMPELNSSGIDTNVQGCVSVC